MKKIITISREFGSGGRELGKRMADLLGFAYIDREIISEIAEQYELSESYVADTLAKKKVAFRSAAMRGKRKLISLPRNSNY